MDYDGDQGSGGFGVDPNDVFQMFFGGGGGGFNMGGDSDFSGFSSRGGRGGAQSFTFRFG
jgi:hypothetical protein